jgi:hypothetical protein
MGGLRLCLACGSCGPARRRILEFMLERDRENKKGRDEPAFFVDKIENGF